MEELRADQGTYSLRLSTGLLRTSHTWMLIVIVLGLPLVFLVYLQSLTEGDGGTSGFWPRLWDELTSDPGDRLMVYTLIALAPLAAWFLMLQRRAGLLVTSVGLEADIPRLLKIVVPGQTVGRWSLRWEDVRNVRLVQPPESVDHVRRLGGTRLLIEASQREVRLSPFSWYEAEGPDHRLGLGNLIAFRKLDVEACLKRSPLMRAVAARGLAIERDAGEAKGGAQQLGFDLTRHKGLVAQMFLFFGAGLYALVDTFLIASWMPLAPLPVVPFVAVGALAAGGAWKLGRGAPTVERAALGVLTVAACLAAVYPGMLRLNASTADAEIVSYVSLGAGRFEPPERWLPPIDLAGEDVPEYWSAYPPGSRHEFTLLEGDAGFYQLEMDSFYERTRRFYRDRDDGEDREDRDNPYKRDDRNRDDRDNRVDRNRDDRNRDDRDNRDNGD